MNLGKISSIVLDFLVEELPIITFVCGFIVGAAMVWIGMTI